MTSNLSQAASNSTSKNVARASSCQRYGTRLWQHGFLNAHATGSGALSNNDQLRATVRPDNLTSGLKLTYQACGRIIYLVNQATKLATMRRHDKRSGTTRELGEIWEVIIGEASNAVERIGVNNNGQLRVKKCRGNLDGSAGYAHARANQCNRTHGGKLQHQWSCFLGKHALSVAWEANNRNLWQHHLNAADNGLGGCQRNVACTRASSCFSSKNSSSREAT